MQLGPSRWPRGKGRQTANRIIRESLPGGADILSASALLNDYVRRSAAEGTAEEALRLLRRGLSALEASAGGSADLVAGIKPLREAVAVLAEFCDGGSDRCVGSAMGLLDAALDDMRDRTRERHDN